MSLHNLDFQMKKAPKHSLGTCLLFWVGEVNLERKVGWEKELLQLAAGLR